MKMLRLTALFFLLASSLLTGAGASSVGDPDALRLARKQWGREVTLSVAYSGSDQAAFKGNGMFYKVILDSITLGLVYSGRIQACGLGGCEQAGRVLPLEFEYFDLCVAIDTNASILRVDIHNYAATYGHAVCSPAWLKQFVGYRGVQELIPGRNVDAISGATVSVNALCADLERIQGYAMKIL